MEKTTGSTFTKIIPITEIKKNSGMQYRFFFTLFSETIAYIFFNDAPPVLFPQFNKERGMEQRKEFVLQEMIMSGS